MTRVHDYALSELPTVMSIDPAKLMELVDADRITVTKADITGVLRAPLTELPKIRALVEEREFCERCNDTQRVTDSLGARDCPECVTPRDPNYVPSFRVDTDDGRFLGVTTCTCDEGDPTWPGHVRGCPLA